MPCALVIVIRVVSKAADKSTLFGERGCQNDNNKET